MASQGLFRCSNEEANVQHHSQAVTCVSADEGTGRSIVFFECGLCSVFVPDESDSGPAYFKFGARSSADSSDFTHIPNTISACASLEGFDIVFSQARSAVLHCLPLGDYDGTQNFVPALSFQRMPEAELLAAADTQGALALFSTADATRLDYKPECCQRLATALYAQQGLLISGDAGGEIRLWNISEASLVPILSLSTPGQVTAVVGTQVAQQKGSSQDSRQVVAGTDQGDVFVWDLDMGNIAEPWEPQTTEVRQVGMLSLSNTAVTQIRSIPSGVAVCCDCTDAALSRVACLDLSNAASPATVSNDTPPRVWHMLPTTVHQNTSIQPSSSPPSETMLTLWSISLDMGVNLQQLPVPSFGAPIRQTPHHSPKHLPGSDQHGSPGRADQHEAHSQTRDPLHPDPASGAVTAVTETAAAASRSSGEITDFVHPKQTQADARALDGVLQSSTGPAGVGHQQMGHDVPAPHRTPVHGSLQDFGMPEEDVGSGFSLRALQPAGIVTVPPAAHPLRSAAATAAANDQRAATDGDGGMVQSVQAVQSTLGPGEGSMGQDGSFGLRAEARSKHVPGAGDLISSVKDSSELERRQLAALLGLERDAGDSPQQDSTAHRAEHEPPAALRDSAAADSVPGMAEVPLRMHRSTPPISDPAGSVRNTDPSVNRASFTPDEHHISVFLAAASRPDAAEHQSMAPEKGAAVLGPSGAIGAPMLSSATARPPTAPDENADVSWDALRAVREQLEAMCCEDEDDEDFASATNAPGDSTTATAPPERLPHASTREAYESSSAGVGATKQLSDGGGVGGEQARPGAQQLTVAGHHDRVDVPASASTDLQVVHTLREQKAALQLQFEALQVGQHPNDVPVLQHSPEPSQQFRIRESQRIVASTSASFTPEQATGTRDDPLATPDSPDSLRSSSVFVSGGLKRYQPPNAMEHADHRSEEPSLTQVNQRLRADRLSIDSRGHQGTPAHNTSAGAGLRGVTVTSGVLNTTNNSSDNSARAATLDQWLSNSQSALLATSPGETLPEHARHIATHRSHASDRSLTSERSPHEPGGVGEGAEPHERQPFSLSQLAAAQHDAQVSPANTQPTEQRRSGGGVAWALDVGAERPFSSGSNAHSAREGSTRVCGRQPGHVAAASIHDGPQNVPVSASRQHSTNTALQPIHRKPSTAALLRRLSRKKPSVREILGKASPPQNSRYGSRQDHAPEHSAQLATPPATRSYHARTTSGSPAPRAARSHNRVTGHALNPPTPQASVRTPPPNAATPPARSSRIPSVARSASALHEHTGVHDSEQDHHHNQPPSATPRGIILVPANPKLLNSTTRSTGTTARAVSRTTKTHRSSSRRSHTRSPSPYRFSVSTMHAPYDDSAPLSQSLGRKAPRRLPLQDRMNTPPSARYHASHAYMEGGATGSMGHDVWDGAPTAGGSLAGAENRHPSHSSSRTSQQPHRKRSCGPQTKGSARKSVTVTAVHAAAPAPHVAGPPAARPGHPAGQCAGSAGAKSGVPGAVASAAAHAVQWEHPHGAVVTEGAVLQESSVSDRPPMAVARWKVERSAGELAASQTAAMRAYPPARSTTDHGADAGTYHAEAGAVQPQPQSQFLPVQYAAEGGGDGLMGLLAQESNPDWQMSNELEGFVPGSAVDVRHSGGDPLHMHVRDAHVVHPEVLKDPKEASYAYAAVEEDHEEHHEWHPLAHPRPGGMTQLLASRIAATAAETAPPVPESSRALVSARRTAATVSANVPHQSTLYVAVPAVPPALAAARAAAAAAVANGEVSRGSTCAAAAEAGAAAAGSALDALRKKSEKRAGKGAKASLRSLSRNVIPPPLMDDLWKWEEQVVQNGQGNAEPEQVSNDTWLFRNHH